MRGIIVSFLLTGLATYANAECANACSGHGKCTSYDMCICNRNWQANDCSERVCQFGLAHVDTPKGDLDQSGTLTGPDHPVIENHFTYPYGTTEQFPVMQDSDLQNLPNSAHYYMECSNKGTCDRGTGECTCYEGYDGIACQRASCPGYPNSCSGHGVCKSIKQLAAADNGNIYKLWDKDTTMGCDCDSGYFGPDCSQRQCKYGVDPLYLDDVSTIKFSIFDVAVLTTSPTASFTDGQNIAKQGYWAIRFFDAFGEDWLTEPIVAGATCAQVVSALENIPNDVIPKGQTYCTLTSKLDEYEGNWGGPDSQHVGRDHFHESPVARSYPIAYNMSIFDIDAGNGALSEYQAIVNHQSSYNGSRYDATFSSGNRRKLSGYIYRLKFYGNPGELPEPQIEIYLDGKRPSLISPGYQVLTKVWTDGQQGENNDNFADHCDGVTVTIGMSSSDAPPLDLTMRNHHYLTGLTITEKALLKTCLGASDFDATNDMDVYNWDYGSVLYPHIIKLVRTVTTYNDGGYYAVIWYDSANSWDNLKGLAAPNLGTFRLLNPFSPPDGYLTDSYEIYTTKGTLALTSSYAEATFGFASKTVFMTNVTYDNIPVNAANAPFDGDISCEVGNNNAYKLNYIRYCLNKGDMFTLLNWELPQFNPPHLNLYTAERLIHTDLLFSVNQRFRSPGMVIANKDKAMHFMTHSITTDISTNWAAAVGFKDSQFQSKDGLASFRVYKFFPAAASTYEYVAPCSNRGICDQSTGTCQCFPGYTSDSCSEQASIAV